MRAITVTPTVYNKQDERWEGRDDEQRFWPRVMWADCGNTTGVCVIWFDPVALLNPRKATISSVLAWWVGHVVGPENRQAYELSRLVRGLGGGAWEQRVVLEPAVEGTGGVVERVVEVAGTAPQGLAVGAESFSVRTVNGTAEFLSSPRISAKLDYILWAGVRDWDGVERRRALLYQSSSEIDKSPRGDSRLEGMHLYTPGPDHRRDATKHCLAHLGKIRTAGLGAFEQIYGWDEDWE